MHAKHADNHELNELSGRVIGCAFTVLNTLGAGLCLLLNFAKPRLEIKRVAHGLWNRIGSSACSACIAFLHLLRKSRWTDVHPTVMAGHVPISANISASCAQARPGWATAAIARKTQRK
jgi:hypothetical protein